MSDYGNTRRGPARRKRPARETVTHDETLARRETIPEAKPGERHTREIDEAWKRGDQQEVEAALRRFAQEDEQVIKMGVYNSTEKEMEIGLEPYGENYTLEPGKGGHVFMCQPIIDTLNELAVQVNEEGILSIYTSGIIYFLPD